MTLRHGFISVSSCISTCNFLLLVYTADKPLYRLIYPQGLGSIFESTSRGLWRMISRQLLELGN